MKMKYKHVEVEAKKAEPVFSKKSRLTGHNYKNRFKRMREEETVPEKSAIDKSQELTNVKGKEPCVHASSSRKMQYLEQRNDSGRDLLLGGEVTKKVKYNVDSGRLPVPSLNLRNTKNTIKENSANKKYHEDIDHIPLQQRLSMKYKSAENDTVKVIQKKCEKQIEKRNQKQKWEIRESLHSSSMKLLQQKLPMKNKNAENDTVKVSQKKCEKQIEELNQKRKRGIQESVHASSLKKVRLLKEVQCSQVRNDSGRDLRHGEGGINILSSNLKSTKSTLEENSANIKHYEDKVHTPLQKKLLPPEDKSVEVDKAKNIKGNEKKCDRQMEKLLHKQKGETEEFHRVWDDKIAKLKSDHKLQAAIIRIIYGKCSTKVDKLEVLDSMLAKKMEETNLLRDTQLKDLEAEQLAARDEEIEKGARWLLDAKACISSKQTSFCKAHSELRAQTLSAEVVKPLIVQHEEHNQASRTVQEKLVMHSNDSDCATSEEVACNVHNRNASCQENEGGMTFPGMPIPAVLELITQPRHLGTEEGISADLPASGDRVPGAMQSLELHKIVDNANPVAMTTDTSNEKFAEVDAIELSDGAKIAGEKIIPNVPASKDTVHARVQSLELHGDVPEELPESVANEIMDNANPGDLSSNTQSEGFGEGDAIGSGEKISASRERVPGEMQSYELQEDILKNSAETIAYEIVDNFNPVEMSANTSVEGEADVVHLPDVLLKGTETDGATIDDHDLAGQVSKTLEQTKASQYPCTLLPLQVQEDEDMVYAEVQGPRVQVAGKVNLSPSEVVASEPPTWEVLAIDTVIAEQSTLKLQDRDTSVMEDQVTPQIEAADLESVDIVAPVSTADLVGAANILHNEVVNQVELALETRSASSVEVPVSENLTNMLTAHSSTERHSEAALIDNNQVNSEIDISDSRVADNVTPMQSHIYEPPIEDYEQLQFMPVDASTSGNLFPSPELECENHNLGRNASGSEPQMLTDEGLEQLSDLLDARLEIQPSPGSRVEASTYFPSNAAAEAVRIPDQDFLQLGGPSHFPTNQAWNSSSLHPDPLQYELEKIRKETEELNKSHEDRMSDMKSEFGKELEELVAEVRRKYLLKFQDAQAQFKLKNYGIIQNEKKLLKNKLLADAISFNSLNMSSMWPLTQQYILQQGFQSSSMQRLMRSAGASASNRQIPSLNRQRVPQISVPHSTRVEPVTDQSFAAPSIQVAQHLETLSRLRAIYTVQHRSIPHLGDNIYSSSPQFQTPVSASASSMVFANHTSPFQNLHHQQQPIAFQNLQQQPIVFQNLQQQPIAFQNIQQQQQPIAFHNLQQQHQTKSFHKFQQLLGFQNLQQQQQQQPIAASQWQSRSHNPQNLGYLPG